MHIAITNTNTNTHQKYKNTSNTAELQKRCLSLHSSIFKLATGKADGRALARIAKFKIQKIKDKIQNTHCETQNTKSKCK